MKVNKSKSPLVSGADTPDEKDIVKAVKGDRFAATLSALDSASADAAASPTRSALRNIAAQYDLSNEENRQSAILESAQLLVKSRLREEYRKSEKVVKDLSRYVAEDPFLKTKLISILQKLRDQKI